MNKFVIIIVVVVALGFLSNQKAKNTQKVEIMQYAMSEVKKDQQELCDQMGKDMRSDKRAFGHMSEAQIVASVEDCKGN